MFRRDRTTMVDCPHCGSSQSEPKGIISTFCRTCGDHFSVSSEPRSSVELPVFRVAGSRNSSIRRACLACGHIQGVPHGAKRIPCRSCGSDIDFQNVDITGHSTRRILTHGELRVARRGFINSTSIRCGSATVAGRIAGRVICSGSLNLSGSEICKAQIQTESLTVERGASLKFLYPLELGEGFIDGRVEGDVFCRGTLRIGRHGILLGDVDARSLIVDRGGIFSGSVRVAVSVQMIEDQEPVAAPQPEPPGEVEPWLPGMALGAA